MKIVTKFAITAAAIGLPFAAYAAGTGLAGQKAGAASPAAASHEAPPKSAVSKSQAEAIALRAAPGQIAEAEYEKEGGAWRWSFDIKQNGKIHEIGVDAMTGKIVEDSWEAAGDKD